MESKLKINLLTLDLVPVSAQRRYAKQFSKYLDSLYTIHTTNLTYSHRMFAFTVN